MADKANEDNKAIATKDAKLDKADEANEIVEAAEADDSDEVIKSIEMPLLFPFSLTKYSAIFAEVKGSFGVNNNQLLGFEAAVDNVRGRLNDGNEIDNQLGTV